MRRLIVGNFLVAAGVVLLTMPAAHFVTGWRAQSVEVPAAPAALARQRPSEGEPLGRLVLPRLGLDLVVFEGTSDETLRKGPGHLSGTAWPDAGLAGGNCVIAGHRDTFFRKLASARTNDVLRVHGPSGISTYRLRERRIVGPEEAWVAARTAEPRITLITCYPFGYVGAAPYRLVWSATPVESAAR